MIRTFPPSGVRDEIVGYDRAGGTLTFVERVPTVVGGFSHVTLVSVGAALLVICWVATYVPARRALTASLAEALRAD